MRTKPRPITSWDEVPIVMDLHFASRILGKGADALRKRAQKGTFPAYKEGSSWRITKDSLQEYIKRLENQNKKEPSA